MKIIKTKCRLASASGHFYPSDAKKLNELVTQQLNAVTAISDYQQPIALIVPHAGLIYSGNVAANAFKRLKYLNQQINSVVLIGPSHHVAFDGVACSSADYFITPLGRVRLDKQVTAKLCQHPLINVVDKAHQIEHSLEVQLPFLQNVLQHFKLIPLLVGNIKQKDMLDVITKITLNHRPLANQLIVISSDLSHFLDYEQAKARDDKTIKAILNYQFRQLTAHDACGYRPLNGLLQFAKQANYKIELLKAQNSGDTAGTKKSVVGYAAFALYKTKNTYSFIQKETLLKIAKQSIKQGFKTGQPLNTKTIKTDKKLNKTAACFVTLKIKGQLRGCIGTLIAHQPLIEGVSQNAFSAAFNDRRFKPLSSTEYKHLELSISVLTPSKAIKFKDENDLKKKIKIGVDGLILIEKDKQATFLPSVWNELTTVELFLSRLKLKADLPANYWSKTIKFERYQTESF